MVKQERLGANKSVLWFPNNPQRSRSAPVMHNAMVDIGLLLEFPGAVSTEHVGLPGRPPAPGRSVGRLPPSCRGWVTQMVDSSGGSAVVVNVTVAGASP